MDDSSHEFYHDIYETLDDMTQNIPQNSHLSHVDPPPPPYVNPHPTPPPPPQPTSADEQHLQDAIVDHINQLQNKNSPH